MARRGAPGPDDFRPQRGRAYDDSLAYSPQEVQHSVLIQSTGQIVIVGWNATENVVIRYNSNGTPDTTF